MSNVTLQLAVSINAISGNYDSYLEDTKRARIPCELLKNIYRSSSLSEENYEKRIKTCKTKIIVVFILLFTIGYFII